MRTVILLLLLGLVACRPLEPQPPSGQRAIVEQDLRSWHSQHHPDCPGFKLIKVDYRGDVHRSHTEIWTVDACGKSYRYQATIEEDFGTQVMVASLE